jgi:hypothetical protein
MSQLAPSLKFRAVGSDGLALVGGKLFSYFAGTSTPKDTFSNQALSSANTNPIILNARGEADVWMDGNYKFVLTTAADVIVWSVDNVNDFTKDGGIFNATLAGVLTIASTVITWSGDPQHSGNHTFNGGVVFNGNVTIGDSAADTLTIRPNAVAWQNNPTHSGNHTFSGNLAVGGTFSAASYAGQVKSINKTATTSRASTTTAADDPHLLLTLVPGVYSFEVFVPVWSTTATTGGLKVQMGFSGTASADFYSTMFETGTLQPVNSVLLTQFSSTTNASTAMIVGTAVNGAGWVRLCGSLNISVAGNLTFKWAQSVSDANAANVGIGGYMTTTRIV